MDGEEIQVPGPRGEQKGGLAIVYAEAQRDMQTFVKGKSAWFIDACAVAHSMKLAYFRVVYVCACACARALNWGLQLNCVIYWTAD